MSTQLYEEIRKWELSQQSTTKALTTPSPPSNIVPPPKYIPKLVFGRDKVEEGAICFKPVDRQAAMLLRKAPWWAHAPHVPEPVKTPEKQAEKKGKIMSTVNVNVGRNPHPAVNPTAEVVHEKSKEEFERELNSEFTKRAKESLARTASLLEQAMDAKAAMEVMSDKWKTQWFDFQEECNGRLKDLRMTRMAMDTEMRQIMVACREVRQFFLDKDYETERARLKEFVEICERLKALKESGFLDSVADTILKLS